MIRAVYRDGAIQPLDDVPAEWKEGKRLEIRELRDDEAENNSDNWLGRLNAAAAKIPQRVHDELAVALAEIEAESKEHARREMEQFK
jgi:predicted DNA-binding antitoxin AbrB/MazE fold protein